MEQSPLFDEKYRVVAVDDHSLILRGVESGEVLTINNADSAVPLSKAEYPIGKLVALSDPAASAEN